MAPQARWPLLLAALWCGGIAAVGFGAVPLAFAHFADPALAGPYAAKLFSGIAWGSVAASIALLLWVRAQRDALAQRLLPWLLLAAIAALLQQYGIAPRILGARAAGESVALWHRLGTALVLLQWGCALRAFWLLSGRR